MNLHIPVVRTMRYPDRGVVCPERLRLQAGWLMAAAVTNHAAQAGQLLPSNSANSGEGWRSSADKIPTLK
jgi:hypothetical protein